MRSRRCARLTTRNCPSPAPRRSQLPMTKRPAGNATRQDTRHTNALAVHVLMHRSDTLESKGTSGEGQRTGLGAGRRGWGPSRMSALPCPALHNPCSPCPSHATQPTRGAVVVHLLLKLSSCCRRNGATTRKVNAGHVASVPRAPQIPSRTAPGQVPHRQKGPDLPKTLPSRAVCAFAAAERLLRV